MILLALLFGLVAEARIEARFLSFIGMMSVTDRVMGKITDEDPQNLYSMMRVEEQREGNKTGKKIELEDKKLTILCVDQGGEQKVCTILVKSGSQAMVSPSKGIIRFVALGQEGQALRAKFEQNQADGSFLYQSADRTFRIAIDDGAFILDYKKP
jgi:hypothetical protein